jgi:hypothetical protein
MTFHNTQAVAQAAAFSHEATLLGTGLARFNWHNADAFAGWLGDVGTQYVDYMEGDTTADGVRDTTVAGEEWDREIEELQADAAYDASADALSRKLGRS